jgi:hypothetical protein
MGAAFGGILSTMKISFHLPIGIRAPSRALPQPDEVPEDLELLRADRYDLLRRFERMLLDPESLTDPDKRRRMLDARRAYQDVTLALYDGFRRDVRRQRR